MNLIAEMNCNAECATVVAIFAFLDEVVLYLKIFVWLLDWYPCDSESEKICYG